MTHFIILTVRDERAAKPTYFINGQTRSSKGCGWMHRFCG
jgi:hypothetical protein